MSPVALLLSIGVGTRTHVDDFEPVAYPSWLQSRITSYAKPVEEIDRILQRGQAHAFPEETRALARKWVQLTESGELLPLPPVNAEDGMREGVKGQILRAVEALCKGLGEMGRRSARSGNVNQASEDLALGIELAQTIKYSDLYSVGLMSQRQRNLLMVIEGFSASLSPADAGALRHRLAAVKAREQSIAPLVVQARQYWAMSQASKGIQSPSIEDVGRVVYADSWTLERPIQRQVDQRLHQLRLAYSAADVPSYIPETGFSGTMHAAAGRAFETVIVELSGHR